MTSNNSVSIKIPVVVNFAAIIIILAGVMYSASIITPFLMALFISIVCAQPIIWLQKKKIPQGLAIAIVFIGIIAVFAGFGGLIGRSLSSFSENASVYEQNLNKMGSSIIQLFHERGINLTTESVSNLVAPSKIMGFTAGILGQLSGFMGNALTITFLVLFLLLELDSVSVKIKAILKDSVVTVNYLNTIGKSIRHYLSIKTLTSLLTGVLIWISLSIIGVDYAIIWGLIAFLLNYIPNIGSIIAALPAVLFSLIQLGFEGVIWTAGVFVAVNMIIGNVIEPRMMGRGMGLSTFVVFVALIFWGFVLGTVGMFLSVPLTMAIKIMFEQSKNTKWIAIVLGTQADAQNVIDEVDLTKDKY